MQDRPDTVEIYQDAQREWRWTRRAGNGEVIADSSEGYGSHAWATVMAERVNTGCTIVDRDATPT